MNRRGGGDDAQREAVGRSSEPARGGGPNVELSPWDAGINRVAHLELHVTERVYDLVVDTGVVARKRVAQRGAVARGRI